MRLEASLGRFAEWLGAGLQNRLQRFESATDLNSENHRGSTVVFLYPSWEYSIVVLCEIEGVIEPQLKLLNKFVFWQFFKEQNIIKVDCENMIVYQCDKRFPSVQRVKARHHSHSQQEFF